MSCWDDNLQGQLGSGTAPDVACPTSVQPAARCQPDGVVVAGGQNWSQLSAGGAHSCGLSTAGAVFCWAATNSARWATPAWLLVGCRCRSLSIPQPYRLSKPSVPVPAGDAAALRQRQDRTCHRAVTDFGRPSGNGVTAGSRIVSSGQKKSAVSIVECRRTRAGPTAGGLAFGTTHRDTVPARTWWLA